MRVHKSAVAALVLAAAMLPSVAGAQTYRPEAFGQTLHTQALEAQAREAVLGLNGMDTTTILKRVRKEREVEPLALFGQLGNFAVENHPDRPDDGFSFKRGSGPRIGNISVGFRRKF
jgi:hypothetical protein